MDKVRELLGARNPLIQRYFLGVFRSARIAPDKCRVSDLRQCAAFRNIVLRLSQSTQTERQPPSPPKGPGQSSPLTAPR